MHTIRLQLDPRQMDTPPAPESLRRAAEILRAGGTVAFATETVYGLGANALDAAAVEKIFAAKQRPAWDPLIVHIGAYEMLGRVTAGLPAKAEALIEKFWPGPLTLLLPRNPQLPLAVTAGRDTVGVRVPAHPAALALLQAANLPLAAPSANRFGHTSPTTAQHVLDDLDGCIDAVLDSGPTTVGIESTVLDISATPAIIYRPGAITREMLLPLLGEVEMHAPPLVSASQSAPASLPSPGVGLRHYAPQARLLLAENQQHFNELQQQTIATGARVGIMLPQDWPQIAPPSPVGVLLCHWPAMDNPAGQAQSLFSALRTLDDLGAEIIICPLPAPGGIGDAIADRLRKAAMKP